MEERSVTDHSQSPPVSSSSLIQMKDVVKTFSTTAGEFTALRGIDLDLQQGEFAAVIGKSGSGKSTLLNMLTGIDHPTSGQILKQDDSFTIKWNATDGIGVVSRSIYFTYDNGANWDLVDSSETNGGTESYTWTVPNVVSKTCKIKIYAYDAAGNVGNKESETFIIEESSGIKPHTLNYT